MIYPKERTFPGEDLNEHVGIIAIGFEGVHKGYGLMEVSPECKSILEFFSTFDLIIANT